MITTGFGFISFVLFFTAIVLVFTKKHPSKFINLSRRLL